MKDDDSSSIVRSQTAHQVNVSEYTGNATTPQNHVTSDVDSVLAISDADAGPARQLTTPDDTHVSDPVARHHDATHSAPVPPTDPHPTLAPEPRTTAGEGVAVPGEPFQDELAAIERPPVSENVQPLPHEPGPRDAFADLEPTPADSPSATHAQAASPEIDNRQAVTSDPTATHIENVANEPVSADITASEAKPVFVDSHATLPDATQGLHDPELDIAELGHAHPLGDPEPEPHADLAATPLADTPHAAHPHHHLPPHAMSPTNAALADLNKDEFQGRLAGIKRDVQALNDRLTDFEAELDKDRVRTPRA